MRKNTPLRVEKRLRPVVPLGRNRVVPFRRNQGGPNTRNPATDTDQTPHMRKTHAMRPFMVMTKARSRALSHSSASMKTRRQNSVGLALVAKLSRSGGTSGNIRVDIELCYGLPCPESNVSWYLIG